MGEKNWKITCRKKKLLITVRHKVLHKPKNMKKIILLLFVSTLQIAFGQCVDLTVKEHFAGDPLFRLESGDIVQICEDSKEISFGGTTLYILTQRGSGGTFIYEFKMDDVYYSPKYGEIQINTNTKKFGITLISGNQGAWTY